MAHSYMVSCKFTDRNLGPGTGRTIRIDAASSITAAIGKASREFWKGLTRKERFDAAKSLRIEAVRSATAADVAAVAAA